MSKPKHCRPKRPLLEEPAKTTYSVVEGQLRNAIDALDVSVVTQNDLDDVYIKCLYLKSHTPSSGLHHKRIKRSKSDASHLVKKVEDKLASYASTLVTLVTSSSENCCSDTFLEKDLSYRQTYHRIAPVLRILEDLQVFDNITKSPAERSLKAGHYFLDMFASYNTEVLSDLLISCFVKARENAIFVDTIAALLQRLQAAEVRLRINQEGSISLPGFYLANVADYVNALNKSPHRSYMEDVQQVIHLEMKLTALLDKDTQEKARVLILNSLLIQKDILTNLVKCLVVHYQLPHQTAVRKDLQKLFIVSRKSDMMEAFVTALVTGIYETLEEVAKTKKMVSHIRDLLEFHKSVLTSIGFEGGLECFAKSSSCVQSELQARTKNSAEVFVQELDSLFNKAWKSTPSNTVGALAESLTEAIEFYKFDKIFTKLYLERSLPRRAIRQGHAFLKVLFDEKNKCLESSFCNAVISRNFAGRGLLQNVINALEDSFKMKSQSFNAGLSIEPVIFGANETGLFYKATEVSERLCLPQDMQDSWDSLLQSSEKHRLQSLDGKKLTLIPVLNTVEISTHYMLGNGQNLVLEMNLIQASLLCLFNDVAIMKYKNAKEALRVKDARLFEMAVSSLSRLGLLHQTGDFISINSNFQPNASLSRGGKLRVDFFK